MTEPTVPPEIYHRHEREWELMREALGKRETPKDKDKKQ